MDANRLWKCINWSFLTWSRIKQSTEHANGPQKCTNWRFQGTTYITQLATHAHGPRSCTKCHFLAWTYIKQSSVHVHGLRSRKPAFQSKDIYYTTFYTCSRISIVNKMAFPSMGTHYRLVWMRTDLSKA